MSLSTKLAVVIAAASVISPIAASANPVVSSGATAAAVSIKFKPCGATNGNFSIIPGGTASGGGTGVSELSAAVATGETSAEAKSASGKYGTTASANGYSAPVHFSYETISKHEADKYSHEYTANSKFEKEAAVQFAANKKESEYYAEESAAATIANVSKSRKSLKGDFVKANSYSEKSGSSSNASLKLNAKLEASASESKTAKTSSQSSSSYTKTAYTYTGSSAGLQYLPH